jgi:exodeoxyribonuclease-3
VIKIISWNVNSVRVRLPHLLELIDSVEPDVILLQETKTENLTFPREEIESKGYQVLIHGQKSYNGVAILSKLPLELIIDHLPGNKDDVQARYLEAKILIEKPITVSTIYLPNGNPVDTEKFPYKLDWMDRLHLHVKKKIDNCETFLLGGDYNIIPTADDAVDISKWYKDALHHPESLQRFRSLMNLGLTDALKTFNSKPYEFTYWDYSRGSWEKDNGLRIDHLLASPFAADRLVDCQIEKRFRSLERPSDHVPIWCGID